MAILLGSCSTLCGHAQCCRLIVLLCTLRCNQVIHCIRFRYQQPPAGRGRLISSSQELYSYTLYKQHHLLAFLNRNRYITTKQVTTSFTVQIRVVLIVKGGTKEGQCQDNRHVNSGCPRQMGRGGHPTKEAHSLFASLAIVSVLQWAVAGSESGWIGWGQVFWLTHCAVVKLSLPCWPFAPWSTPAISFPFCRLRSSLGGFLSLKQIGACQTIPLSFRQTWTGPERSSGCT